MVITIEAALANGDEDMMVEQNRLRSFDRGWVFADGRCTKENLAKAGFYFCSPQADGDCVRCFCCFKELEGWESGDDPWKEHLSHNSSCLFAQLHKEEFDLTVAECIQIAQARDVNKRKKQAMANYQREAEKLDGKIAK